MRTKNMLYKLIRGSEILYFDDPGLAFERYNKSKTEKYILINLYILNENEEYVLIFHKELKDGQVQHISINAYGKKK